MSNTAVLDWRAIFLGMPYAAAILDAQGTIVVGNTRMDELLSLETTDYLGKKCCDIFHDPETSNRPNDCPFVRMLETGKMEKGEMYLRSLGAYCIASCSPFFDAQGQLSFAIHSFTEITQHKLAEEALKKGEERLRNVINGTNAGTWEWNVQTGEASMDERSAAILGHSLEELQPLSVEAWMRFNHPDDRQRSNEELNRHTRGETEFYSNETRMRHKQGSWVWVHTRGKIIEWDSRGLPLRMFGTHVDITERKQSEERIRALLEEKELILKEVHHRVKNNMSTIYSFLCLQAATLNDPSAISALEDAANRVQSMLLLYDTLYRHSDFMTVSLSLYVPPLVDEIASTFPNSASVRITMDIADISLDIKKAQALGIIINELLTNAMKYAFVGKSGGTISVSASLSGGLVRFIVEDDGLGLPEPLNFENSGGFGFTLIDGLTKQLAGSLRIERMRGTKVILEFAR
jgi:PAS domain S-box-containing protein